MKKQQLKKIVLFSALTALSFASCKKEEQVKPEATNPARSAKILGDEIRSNEGYLFGLPIGATINENKINATYLGSYKITTNSDYTSTYPAGMKGYAEYFNGGFGTTAITYNEATTHYPMITYVADPTYGGNSFRIKNGGTDFNVDEIEVNPADGYVYAVGYHLTSIGLYRLVPNLSTGNADATYMGELFHNYTTNGYNSGSIAFVQDQTSLAWYLAFTNESAHYTGLGYGILEWNFTVGSTSIAADASHPNSNYTGVSGTGNINSVAMHGILYLARDGQTLYSLPSGSGAHTAVSIGTIAANNDFGPQEF